MIVLMTCGTSGCGRSSAGRHAEGGGAHRRPRRRPRTDQADMTNSIPTVIGGSGARGWPKPLQVICDMMGIRPGDEDRIFHWTNDPSVSAIPTSPATTANSGCTCGYRRVRPSARRDRRASAWDDLTSALVRGPEWTAGLTSAEVASFFILLVVAGGTLSAAGPSRGPGGTPAVVGR